MRMHVDDVEISCGSRKVKRSKLYLLVDIAYMDDHGYLLYNRSLELEPRLRSFMSEANEMFQDTASCAIVHDEVDSLLLALLTGRRAVYTLNEMNMYSHPAPAVLDGVHHQTHEGCCAVSKMESLYLRVMGRSMQDIIRNHVTLGFAPTTNHLFIVVRKAGGDAVAELRTLTQLHLPPMAIHEKELDVSYWKMDDRRNLPMWNLLQSFGEVDF